MSDASFWNDGVLDERTGEPRKRKADWPLMGDIVSQRAGVPDHLIRWRRAEGADDPDPTL